MSPRLELEHHIFSHPKVGTSRLVMTERESLLLHLTTEHVRVTSEAAPLEGYGRDSISLARAELACVAVDSVLSAVEEVSEAFQRSRGGIGKSGAAIRRASEFASRCRSASARCCLEVLILRAVASRHGISLFEVLGRQPVAPRLLTSCVIDPLSERFLDEAGEALAAGIRTLKIKCGRDSEREISAMNSIASMGAEGTTLRVDANGAWSSSEARTFIASCRHLPIQWFEDPTNHPRQWGQLIGPDTTAAFAMDEPLIFEEREALSEIPVRALVLKPMALGGLGPCLAWADACTKRGLAVCVSHFFDGPWAMDAYIALAFCVQTPTVATGLGLHQALIGRQDSLGSQLFPSRISLISDVEHVD